MTGDYVYDYVHDMGQLSLLSKRLHNRRLLDERTHFCMNEPTRSPEKA
jgi:hypothetical protein